MVVIMKKTKGGQWLGVIPELGRDAAVWAGSVEKVKQSQMWRELSSQGAKIEFDISDDVWEDTLHLLPIEEVIKK